MHFLRSRKSNPVDQICKFIRFPYILNKADRNWTNLFIEYLKKIPEIKINIHMEESIEELILSLQIGLLALYKTKYLPLLQSEILEKYSSFLYGLSLTEGTKHGDLLINAQLLLEMQLEIYTNNLTLEEFTLEKINFYYEVVYHLLSSPLKISTFNEFYDADKLGARILDLLKQYPHLNAEKGMNVLHYIVLAAPLWGQSFIEEDDRIKETLNEVIAKKCE